MSSYTTALYDGRRYRLVTEQKDRALLRARAGAAIREFWVSSYEIEVQEPDSPPARRRYEGHDPGRHPTQQ